MIFMWVTSGVFKIVNYKGIPYTIRPKGRYGILKHLSVRVDSASQKEAKTGSQGKKRKAGTKAETPEEGCFLAYSSSLRR